MADHVHPTNAGFEKHRKVSRESDTPRQRPLFTDYQQDGDTKDLGADQRVSHPSQTVEPNFLSSGCNGSPDTGSRTHTLLEQCRESE